LTPSSTSSVVDPNPNVLAIAFLLILKNWEAILARDRLQQWSDPLTQSLL
jgi:hypothetical protein